MKPGILFEHFLDKLAAQRSSPAKDKPHAAQIRPVALVLVRHHLYEDWRNDIELLDAETLDGSQKGLELEARQDDDLVTAVLAEEGDERQAVDVAQGEQAEHDLRVDSVVLPRHAVV